MKQLLACPGCTGTMVSENFGSAFVEVCTECGGLWLDAGELATLDYRTQGVGPKLVEAVRPPHPEPTRPATPAAPRTCSVCRVPMTRQGYELAPEIEIDLCPGCAGTFLGAGALAALRQRPLSQREQIRDRVRQRRRRARRGAGPRGAGQDDGLALAMLLLWMLGDD